MDIICDFCGRIGKVDTEDPESFLYPGVKEALDRLKPGQTATGRGTCPECQAKRPVN